MFKGRVVTGLLIQWFNDTIKVSMLPYFSSAILSMLVMATILCRVPIRIGTSHYQE